MGMINRRVKATIPVTIQSEDSFDGWKTVERTAWGFVVNTKKYNWEDQDILVFYDIEFDDGEIFPVYEENVVFMGWRRNEA